MENSVNFQIIGFDLGHGKTALAEVKVSPRNDSEPKDIEIIEIQNEKFQMTAITEDPDGLPIIGEVAFLSAQNSHAENKEVIEFEISFKQRPSRASEDTQQTIKNFVQAIYSILEKDNKLQTSFKPMFFVGCPSGWDQADQNNYKKLMAEAGLCDVVVVPESRAAFMQALKNGKFKFEEIKKGILVIDIGSSTTDFTLVFDNKAEDLGEHKYDLGASLIEQQILQYAIANHPDRKKIEKHFQVNQLDKKIWEIECRKVKEQYFARPVPFKDHDAKHIDRLQQNIYFEVKANYHIIQEIINKPLKELSGNSWKQSFRTQLIRIKENFDEKSIITRKILITGGGARMDFIKEICQEIFPDSLSELDNEFELCVARGLARWGRVFVKKTKLEEEINQFIQDSLSNIVKKYFDIYLDNLADIITNGLLNEALKNSLIDFRNEKIKKENLEAKIQERSRQWLQSSDFKSQSNEQEKKQAEDIEKEVQTKIDSICKKYGIEDGTLTIKLKRPINFKLNVLHKLSDIYPDAKSLSTNSVTTIGGAILSGGVVYSATVIIITDAFLEAILAPITGGLSVILSPFILAPILKKIKLTDENIKNILEKEKHNQKSIIKQQLDNNQKQLRQITEVITEELKNTIKTQLKEKDDNIFLQLAL